MNDTDRLPSKGAQLQSVGVLVVVSLNKLLDRHPFVGNLKRHGDNVTSLFCDALMSQWVPWHLISPAPWLFVQTSIQANFIGHHSPRQWSFVRWGWLVDSCHAQRANEANSVPRLTHQIYFSIYRKKPNKNSICLSQQINVCRQIAFVSSGPRKDERSWCGFRNMGIVESRQNIIYLLNLPTAHTAIINFWGHDVDCLLCFQLYVIH